MLNKQENKLLIETCANEKDTESPYFGYNIPFQQETDIIASDGFACMSIVSNIKNLNECVEIFDKNDFDKPQNVRRNFSKPDIKNLINFDGKLFAKKLKAALKFKIKGQQLYVTEIKSIEEGLIIQVIKGEKLKTSFFIPCENHMDKNLNGGINAHYFLRALKLFKNPFCFGRQNLYGRLAPYVFLKDNMEHYIMPIRL